MAHTRRYSDLKVLYSLDFANHQTVVRQRVYKSADGTVETPITNLFNQRLVASTLPAPKVRRFRPRQAIACLLNPANQSGVSELMVVLPYAPTSPNLQPHIREIRQANNVEAASYRGESHDLSVEPYL